MEQIIELISNSFRSETVFSMTFFIIVISMMVGVNRGLWPFITEKWWPHYKQRETDEQKQLEILNRIYAESKYASQKLDAIQDSMVILSDKIATFEPLSDVSIDAVRKLIQTGSQTVVRRKYDRDRTMNRLIDEVGDKRNEPNRDTGDR